MKVAAFFAGLVLLFAVAFVIGGAVGPFDSKGTNVVREPALGFPGGLLISQDGYTLRVAQTPVQPGVETPLRFSITDPNGQVLTKFQRTHEKRLHLILARRDLAHYQHLHPKLGQDGMWTVPVAVPAAGQYRMFADFQPVDAKVLTLGADFSVAGDYVPAELSQSTKSTVDDYEVSLTGTLLAGKTNRLTLEVRKAGQPVTDLQPYLGAFGHLVALRDGDLAYLHVHPEEMKAPGPKIIFYAEVPSTGDYRLYLDFKHGEVVRTAEFTVSASAIAPETGQDPHNEHGGHG